MDDNYTARLALAASMLTAFAAWLAQNGHLSEPGEDMHLVVKYLGESAKTQAESIAQLAINERNRAR